jgi:hypothetical protein
LLPLFALKNDGSAAIRHWRLLLCPTVCGVTDHTLRGHVHTHVLHDHCAQQWFIFKQKNTCASCKHDFFDILFQDIATAQHSGAKQRQQRVDWASDEDWNSDAYFITLSQLTHHRFSKNEHDYVLKLRKEGCILPNLLAWLSYICVSCCELFFKNCRKNSDGKPIMTKPHDQPQTPAKFY